MEEVKMDYGEAQKILKRRIAPMARSLGEKFNDEEHHNPLGSENFNIEIASTHPSWAGESDYSEVNLSIVTVEYPHSRRRVNKINVKKGSLKTFKEKLKEIIAENKGMISKKSKDEQDQKTRCRALMLKFKEFEPRNEGWGIIIRSRRLRFEINAYRDEVEVHFSGKTDEIADIIRRLK
jgi:hypothetical protein